VVQHILDGVEDVHFTPLSSADVVQHRLVGDIVDAYARWDAAQDSVQPGSVSSGRAQGAYPVANRADRRRRR